MKKNLDRSVIFIEYRFIVVIDCVYVCFFLYNFYFFFKCDMILLFCNIKIYLWMGDRNEELYLNK